MKKAQSQIITTVLIILLVLAAIVIVWQVVQGTVNTSTDEIEKTSNCIEAIGVLEVDGAGSCYDGVRIKVKVDKSLKDITIDKFIILVNEGTEKYEIENGPSGGSVSMLTNGPPTLNLQVPSQGESKSYLITTTLSDSLQVAPIINEKLCSPSGEIEIDSC